MAKCQKIKDDGEKCGSFPIKNTREGVLDPRFCMGHQERSAKDAVGFAGPQEGSGPPRKPRTIDVLREKVEELTDEILAPFIGGLSAEKCIGHRTDENDPEGPKIPIMVPDLKTQQESARELLDRGYGRPTQATEISGPDGGPIPMGGVSVPEGADEAELHDIADALAKRRAG